MNVLSASKDGPPLPRRAAIYLRVSSEEQVQGYSLDAQERACRMYCEMHGWRVVNLYRDEGRSARTEQLSKRPAFAKMLEDAETGRIDVVIVHKLDRLARNRTIAFDAFNRLGTANVGFVSIAENLDYSTPAGQLMLTMLVGIAQFYSDNLSFETRKGKAERKRKGLYNGLVPFGATKGPDGVPTLDTEARWCNVTTRAEVVPARGLQLAFQLAASGQTDREIAQALNADGYRTSGNRGQNPFTKDTVRSILRNRFYLGELPDGNGGWLPGKHSPLIDQTLFARAESGRHANTNRAREVSTLRSPWALSGVATCGTCGFSMTISHHMTGKRRIRCAGRGQGSGCDEPSCFAHVIEEQIGALLAAFAVPAATQQRLLNIWRHYQGRDGSTGPTRVRLQRKLKRLKELYLEGDLTKKEFQDQKANVTDELAGLPLEGNPDNDDGARLASYLSNVSRAWLEATPEERNKLARQLFLRVVVKNKTAVAVVPRPDVRPFFTLVAVNSDEKECTGGSDGDRSRRCVTCHQARSSSLMHPSSTESANADALPISSLALASSHRERLTQSDGPPTKLCETWRPSMVSPMRRSGVYGVALQVPRDRHQSSEPGSHP